MRFRVALLSLLASLALAQPARAAASDKPGWQLTFDDEFDGADVDATRWVKRYKWGEAQINGELQAYVDDAFQLQDGVLTIAGDRRAATYAGQTFEYASGVLCSVHEQTYGYFEARLKVPAGQGLWPAFWLLGQVGAPGVNEIDIHEILGHQPSTVYMTVHWGTDYGAGHKSDGSDWVGPDFSSDFHVFGLEWSPDAIVWTIDGVERKRHSGEGVPQVPMYVILNLAVGGSWPGAPDATTPFPGRYQIDYVRAYAPLADAGGASGTAGASGTGGASGTAGAGGGTGAAPATGGGGCGCRLDGAGGRAPACGAFVLIALLLLSRRGPTRGSSGKRAAALVVVFALALGAARAQADGDSREIKAREDSATAQPAASPPPQSTITTIAAPAPAPAAPAGAAPAAVVHVDTPAPPAPAETPVYARWWFWTLIGAAVVAAGVGVAAATGSFDRTENAGCPSGFMCPR